MNPEHITLFCLGVFLIATYFIAKSVHNYFDHYLQCKKFTLCHKAEMEKLNKMLGKEKQGNLVSISKDTK